MKQDYELMIQRLIDGELQEADRRRFLQALDRRPDLWRDVALAFVEDQVWRSYSLEEADTQNLSMRKLVRETVGVRPRNGFAPHLLLVAALLLLTATIVMRFDSNLTNSPSQNAQVGIPDGTTLANKPHMLRLGPENQPDIPLYSQLDEMASGFANPEFAITPAVQEEFLNAGYRIQPDSRFYVGHTEDGRAFIVPVQGIRVHDFVQ